MPICTKYDRSPEADDAGGAVSDGVIANTIQRTAPEIQMEMIYVCTCQHRFGQHRLGLHGSPLSPNANTCT